MTKDLYVSDNVTVIISESTKFVATLKLTCGRRLLTIGVTE